MPGFDGHAPAVVGHSGVQGVLNGAKRLHCFLITRQASFVRVVGERDCDVGFKQWRGQRDQWWKHADNDWVVVHHRLSDLPITVTNQREFGC